MPIVVEISFDAGEPSGSGSIRPVVRASGLSGDWNKLAPCVPHAGGHAGESRYVFREFAKTAKEPIDEPDAT